MADGERPYLCNAVEVPVHVYNAKSMVQRRLGDEQIWDWRSVPHPVVMREVALELQRAVQDVGRRDHDVEVCVEV